MEKAEASVLSYYDECAFQSKGKNRGIFYFNTHTAMCLQFGTYFGKDVVMKTMKRDADGSNDLKIHSHLSRAGKRVPKVYQTGIYTCPLHHRERYFVVMEFVMAIPISALLSLHNNPSKEYEPMGNPSIRYPTVKGRHVRGLGVRFWNELARDIAQSVAEIHAERVTHNDLHTRNLLVRLPLIKGEAPKCVVVDFEYASMETLMMTDEDQVSRMTLLRDDGTIAGCMHLPPERYQTVICSNSGAERDTVTKRDSYLSDSYAVGVIIWYIYTGSVLAGSFSDSVTCETYDWKLRSTAEIVTDYRLFLWAERIEFSLRNSCHAARGPMEHAMLAITHPNPEERMCVGELCARLWPRSSKVRDARVIHSAPAPVTAIAIATA